MVDLNPVEIHNAEGLAKSMLRVLTLSHLEVAGNLSNETATLGKTLIVNVLDILEAVRVQEP